MRRRTTCEGVASSSAHSRSKSAFLRGSTRIVSRAVRSSSVTVGVLVQGAIFALSAGELRIIIQGTAESASVIPLIHSPLSASLTLLAVWGAIGLAGLLRP